MQTVSEYVIYERLGFLINDIRRDLPNKTGPYLQSAISALDALENALIRQQSINQFNPCVLSAIKDHIPFWRANGMPAHTLILLENNQQLQSIMGQERSATCTMLLQNVSGLLHEAAFTPVRQAQLNDKLNGSDTRYFSSALAYRLLTVPQDFEREALHYRCETPNEKDKFRTKILAHWLSLQATESNFMTSRAALLEIVNTTDNLVKDRLRSFAAAQLANAQPPIDPAFFGQLNDAEIAQVRMKAVEQIINNETNLDTIKSLVNKEDAAWRSMGINNTQWMTVEQKDTIARLVNNRLIVLEQNPAEKTANQNIFHQKVDNLAVLPNQKVSMKWIFEQLTVTEQQSVLQKCEQPAFFEKIFRATSPEALRFYLGIKENHRLGNVELGLLTDRNNRLKSLVNSDIASLFDDENFVYDPTAMNELILGWYNTIHPNEPAAIAALKIRINHHFGLNNLQNPLLQWSPNTERSLLDSAVIFKDLFNKDLYDQNKSFYQYLLHTIPSELVDNQAVPPESNLALISSLVTKFQNATTLGDFKRSLGDMPASIWNVLIKMDDSTFKELKNKTLIENLTNIELRDTKKRDAAIAKVLKRSHEQILKPMRDDFRRSQKSLEELSEKMIQARQLIEPAMGVREFASAHKDEVKRELLGVIEVAQKMEQKLGRNITKLKDYKDALGKAAAAGNIRTPEFKEEFAIVTRHLKELEQARDTWHQFREDFGFLTKEESTPAYPSIYVDITSAEQESAQAESARFPFTAKRVKPIVAKDIATYPPNVAPDPVELNNEIGTREKYSLTKKADFVPVLKPNEMHELRVPYINERTQQEETMVFTKQSHGDGRFTTSLRTPPKTPTGEFEFITQAEWAIASQKRGNKFELSGKKEYVAKMYAIFTRLGVPPSMIDTTSASTYDPKDTSSPEHKAAQAFIGKEELQERFDTSKKRLVEWRTAPQRADNVSLNAKGRLQGIIAEAAPEIKTEDDNDYTQESPRI